MSTEELEASAKLDMEKFLMADPPPSDIESEEYYACNRRRVERARAFISAFALNAIIGLQERRDQ